ncbi:MAG: DUF5711 family protein, partial [Lachnospiraceae bacterium]|nr:DUF5711 family protein [Lachnospiraceae bacterium]
QKETERKKTDWEHFGDDSFAEDVFARIDLEEDSDYEEPDEDNFDEESEFTEDGAGVDEYEDLNDDDEEYLMSAAYKRRARKVLTPEQREEKRLKRIEAFWDLVDRRSKQIRWGIVGLIVIIAALITGLIIRNWTFNSYKELVVSDKEDTLSVSYANINGKVLKYGVDGAMFVDHSNTMLWTISYAMSAPEVVQCGDTFAIYDSKGTSICICNDAGQIGEVSADKPIVKAKIAKQGVVAAILEDGQNAWIKSYTKEGTEIATLKTTFTNPGYPLDLALSEDGTLMAVDYLYIDNGTPVSRISFYNFGTVGQNQKDNLVAETEYRDKILPEIEYLDSSTCVVFRENGFSVYTGGQIPSESVKVDVEQNIVSTFHDSEYIGLVLQNRNSEKEYLIRVYNKKGKEILEEETDFRYQAIEMNGGQIVLSSRDEFCVYSLQGVEKYRGSLDVPASDFRGFGRNKFIYVTEDIFRIIQLR